MSPVIDAGSAFVKRAPMRGLLATLLLLMLGACAEETGGSGSRGTAGPEQPVDGQPVPGAPAGEPGEGGDTGDSGSVASFERSVAYIAAEDDGKLQKLYAIDFDGLNPVDLTGTPAKPGNVSAVALSPDGQWAAYVADHDREAVLDLYVTNRDGSDRRRLTRGLDPGSSVRSVNWSPDSGQLGYLISNSQIGKKDELWIASVDGASNRRVIPGVVGDFPSGSGFSWSANSRYLGLSLKLTTGNRYFSIPTAGESTAVSIGRGNIRSNSWGAWSTVDNRFAFVSTASNGAPVLTSFDVASGVRTEMVSPLGISDGIFSLRWSPDSSSIASFATRNGRNKGGIFVASSTGGANIQVSRESDELNAVRNFSWSPDSSSLVVVAREDGLDQLVLARADGSAAVYPLADRGGNVQATGAAWSPDGQYLAFIDGREKGSLYLSDGGGFGNRQKLTTQARLYGSLYWARNGSGVLYEAEVQDDQRRKVYFVSSDGQENRLLSSNLAGEDKVLCMAVMPTGVAADQQNSCKLFNGQ